MLVILSDRQVSDSLAKCLGAKLVSMAFPYSAVGSSIAAVDYLVVRQEEMLHDENGVILITHQELTQNCAQDYQYGMLWKHCRFCLGHRHLMDPL